MVYICSNNWLLPVGSRDLSQAEKKATQANLQNDNYFHSKWSKVVILSENIFFSLSLLQELFSSQLKINHVIQTVNYLNKCRPPKIPEQSS